MEHLNLTTIIPVENYTPPNIPTLDSLQGQPPPTPKSAALWKKSALTLAAAGLLGMSSLTGCQSTSPEDLVLPVYGGYPATTEAIINQQQDLALRFHHGGAGRPFYVVHFTEAEALEIIHRQLSAAGLRLDGTPPSVTFYEEGYTFDVSLDLFDDQKQVAIYHLDWRNSNIPFMPWDQRMADLAIEEFREMEALDDISIGVFYTASLDINHDLDINTRRWDGEITAEGDWVFHQPPPAAHVANINTRARPLLEANLTQQVDAFIQYLQDQGVL